MALNDMKSDFFLVGYSCRFEQYVDYALDVPMVFVYRENKYIDCRDMSFRVIISQISLPFHLRLVLCNINIYS